MIATASTNDVIIAAFTTVAAVVATVWGATHVSNKNTAEVKESVGTPTNGHTIAEMLSDHTVKLNQLENQVTDLSNNFSAYQLRAIGARDDFKDDLERLQKRLPLKEEP